MSSLFGIENSLNSARWVMDDHPVEDIQNLSRKYDLPEIAARLILSQGISGDKIQEFLNPTLKDHLPNPSSMAGMTEMARNAAKAVMDGKNIAIFGDFDVDGATSSAILHRFLRACDVEAPIYIPDRIEEGYGPNIAAMQHLKDTHGTDLLFILDCGTTAHTIIEQGREIGLDIIILDHHEPGETLPPANHIINPKRSDDTSGLSVLAACGVTFMACIAINSELRNQGFFTNNETARAEPKLIKLLDLVALGTVCDMVPLTDVNRLLVKSGYKLMQNTDNAGLKALIDVCGLNGQELTTYHAGFCLGPRINAGSRVHEADLGARLLSTDNYETTRNIAFTLEDCNKKRQSLERTMLAEAITQIEQKALDQHPIILVSDENWYPGLTGLVAGRIKQRYNKPACAVTFAQRENGEMVGTGSGRSIPGINMAQLFSKGTDMGLLEKGGGHAMAGGFTIRPDKLDDFTAYLIEEAEKQQDGLDIKTERCISAVLSPHGATLDLLNLLENSLGPFGQGHSEPIFVFNNVRLHNVDIRGGSHISVLFSGQEGGHRMKAMAFGAVGTPLGQALLKEGRRPFHLCGALKLNEWQGRRSVELHIQDAAFADHSLEKSSDVKMAYNE